MTTSIDNIVNVICASAKELMERKSLALVKADALSVSEQLLSEQVKLISGYHVTSHDKKVIEHMHKMGWPEAHTKQKNFKMERTGTDNQFKVEIVKAETNDYGKKTSRKWTVVVEITAKGK